jgi:hypothetical protein
VLHEFINSNRAELIARCKTKAAKRFTVASAPTEDPEHGGPRFLLQLAVALFNENHSGTEVLGVEPASAPDLSDIGRAAAAHGAALLRFGYSVDQIVHDYGDVCQAVTDLAVECNMSISPQEFRTLNRCLDDAIAAAMTAVWQFRQSLIDKRMVILYERLNSFSDEHRRVVDEVIRSIGVPDAIATSPGADGRLSPIQVLEVLRTLPERSLGDIRVASAMATAEHNRS